MYYSQNTQNIRTVILSFDGVMTGLAKLRYNYYRRFCKLYDQKLDNETYFNQCHSFSTMYHHCPIASTLITEENLSKKVEEDLYAYSLNHGVKINEGFDELFDLIRSKKMNLIYTSTHPKKYTEPLFVLTGSLYRPNEFYYNDESVYEMHKDHPSEVLVIASNMHTVKLANKYRFNVIYYPSCQEENNEITIRSFAVIHHLIEAINLILDKWREPRHQYLLIKENGNLDEEYDTLLHTSSSTLHHAITEIYNDEKENNTHTAAQTNLIEEETNVIQEEIIEVEETITEPTKNKILPLLEDGEELFEKTMIFNLEKEELDEEENFTLEPLEEITEDTHTDLDTILNDLTIREQNINHTKVFTKEELKEFGMSEDDLYNEDDQEDDESLPLIKIVLNTFIYAVIDAILILLMYLALSIGLYDWIFKDNSPLSFIQNIVKLIHNVSMKVFGSISTIIGQSINASQSLVEGMAVFILITIVLWIILFIIELIRSKKHAN